MKIRRALPPQLATFDAWGGGERTIPRTYVEDTDRLELALAAALRDYRNMGFKPCSASEARAQIDIGVARIMAIVREHINRTVEDALT